jgi:predicted DCC family thiol-disulfide oxidoreductase YuxK
MNPVVFFDGECNLCNTTVQFILRHEATRDITFCPLQSDYADNTIDVDDDTVVLQEDAHVYTKSAAALRIAVHLTWPWRLLTIFRIIPTPIRDGIYDVIARNRYNWFGKRETCMVPDTTIEDRFIT